MRFLLWFGLFWPAVAAADVLVPLRTIRPQSIVTTADFRIDPADVADALPVTADIDGLETRVALYPGRPVRKGDLGPPALVDRNDIVSLRFARGGLVILTEGRALSRGGSGDTVRVMNLGSRSMVTGRIRADGMVEVD